MYVANVTYTRNNQDFLLNFSFYFSNLEQTSINKQYLDHLS